MLKKVELPQRQVLFMRPEAIRRRLLYKCSENKQLWYERPV